MIVHIAARSSQSGGKQRDGATAPAHHVAQSDWRTIASVSKNTARCELPPARLQEHRRASKSRNVHTRTRVALLQYYYSVGEELLQL